ncbi:MAG: Na/Pi symporter [Bryobacteraceae bacterium]|nr:Na/Pi cotransporter family protein [Solibacteraceae bacterium]MCL4840561.1 Na/Pi symporter [Bryobacteraceae bacterium]MCO5350516.1 Na/Pi symporter [Bryobacteraceae bacterium]
MTGLLFSLLGGIGLFLVGMVLLSDGLKAFAGNRLRTALVRFTGRPSAALASGALVTALVQSSSATTVTMIGFVSAGLLTFPQAVGVILGASLGTTSTGWIVSVLGLKISIGQYAMPLIGIGAFVRLLGRGRWRSLGLAVAGFGLIFAGIEALQTAMAGLSGNLNLSGLDAGGLLGRVLAVGIGVALTIVLQSSSAAVATTLTALHTGSLNFEQAALLVIGASIGTTVTGALAAIGASVPAKRTALALVLFNSATGVIAVLLLPLLLWLIDWGQRTAGLEAGAVSLAAFHTAFVAIGVLLFLPLIERFSRAVENLLPDRGPALTAHLDRLVLDVPEVALEAAFRALREISIEAFNALQDSLRDPPGRAVDKARRVRIREAIRQTQEFLAAIPATNEPGTAALRVSLLHGLDHLVRLQSYLKLPEKLIQSFNHDPVKPPLARCRDILECASNGLRGFDSGPWLEAVRQKSEFLGQANRLERPKLLQKSAAGVWNDAAVLDALDALRWLNTVGYHVWRIGHYLGGETPATAEPAEWEPLPEETS